MAPINRAKPEPIIRRNVLTDEDQPFAELVASYLAKLGWSQYDAGENLRVQDPGLGRLRNVTINRWLADGDRRAVPDVAKQRRVIELLEAALVHAGHARQQQRRLL